MIIFILIFLRIFSQFYYINKSIIKIINNFNKKYNFILIYFLLITFLMIIWLNSLYLKYQSDILKLIGLKNNLFYILPNSNYPFLICIYISCLFRSIILYLKFGYFFNLIFSIFNFVLILLIWGKNIIIESLIGFHTSQIKRGIKICFYYFLLTEVIFFFSMFWIYFDSALRPLRELGEIWAPLGIELINPFGVPILNSIVLLSRAVSLTIRHYEFLIKKNNKIRLIITIFLGIFFLIVQILEYSNRIFRIRDSIYGSLFYLLTGFHGLHVFIGTLFLIFNLIRLIKNHLLLTHHLSFEFSILYWHFVDVIWLYLYLFIYWWRY